MFERVVLDVSLCIALLGLAAFLVCMAVYIVALTCRLTGVPMDRKKAVEAVEEKEKREKTELAKSKVGKII